MANKTSLKFQIVETRLGGEARYIARIPNPHNFDEAALVNKMMDLGTSVSRGDVESVLGLLQDAVVRICAEGSTACLDGFVRFAPAISGTFEGDKDAYQPGRNNAYVNASVSSIFNERFAKAIFVERTTGNFKRPKVSTVSDFATATVNQTVTVNSIITLTGEALKFDLENPAEFLRFVNDDDANQFVGITKFHKQTDGQLVFLMPSVTFTKGHFEVANSMNTSTVRQERSKSVEVAA